MAATGYISTAEHFDNRLVIPGAYDPVVGRGHSQNRYRPYSVPDIFEGEKETTGSSIASGGTKNAIKALQKKNGEPVVDFSDRPRKIKNGIFQKPAEI